MNLKTCCKRSCATCRGKEEWVWHPYSIAPKQTRRKTSLTLARMSSGSLLSANTMYPWDSKGHGELMTAGSTTHERLGCHHSRGDRWPWPGAEGHRRTCPLVREHQRLSMLWCTHWYWKDTHKVCWTTRELDSKCLDGLQQPTGRQMAEF